MNQTDRLALIYDLALAVENLLREPNPIQYGRQIFDFMQMIQFLANKSDRFIEINVKKFNKARVEALAINRRNKKAD